MSMPAIDMVVIVAYLIGIMLIGILSVRKKTLTGDVYFLAGRSLNWPVVGAALFASNISTIHLVGLAEAGFKDGLVIANFELMAAFTLMLLALVFIPFYFKSHITTLPEYLEKRYGRMARTIMAFMGIVAALLIHIGISLYSGAAVFEEFFGLNVIVSICIISAVTAIYTVVGGLTAVVVTETVQTVILLGGAVIVTFLAMSKLPEKDIHSLADFNQAIEIIHREDSFNAAATVLEATNWLSTDAESLKPLSDELQQVAKQIDAEQVDAEQVDKHKAQLREIVARLQQQQRASAFYQLLDLGKVGGLPEILKEKKAPTEKDHKQESLSEEDNNERQQQQATNLEKLLTKASEKLKEMATKPQATTDDLMWAVGGNIKVAEKLGLVTETLRQAGYEEIAEVFGNQKRWDDLEPSTGDLLAAAQMLRTSPVRDPAAVEEDTTRTPHLSMLRSEGPYSWLAILLGYPILGVWYWCSDQTIVQRALGAKNQLESQRGALFAGLLKTLPLFIMVLPGVLAYVIFRDEIGSNAKGTLPVLINELVPAGIKGLIAAALLAALMSTIAAALNSAGTLMAVDIVKHFRPQTTDRQQVLIGRITAVVVMLLAMAWSTQGGKFGSIFEAINKMPAQFLAPPITVVFVWGVFWRRGTKQAALTTLLLGFLVGFVVFLIDLPLFGEVQWITDERRGLGIPFMLQAVWGFVIWSVLYVVISLLTPAPPAAQVENTTWTNPWQVIFHSKLTGLGDPRVLTLGLFIFVAIIYYMFR